MWTRVKGDNLNNTMVIFILIVFGTLLVVGLVRRSRKHRYRRRL